MNMLSKSNLLNKYIYQEATSSGDHKFVIPLQAGS